MKRTGVWIWGVLLTATIAAGVLAGCGNSGGGAMFTMSTATLWLDQGLVYADVAKETVCLPDPPGPSFTIPAPDVVTLKITSTATGGAQSSGLTVKNIRVSYSPANAIAPPLAAINQPKNMTISSGGSAEIAVEVAKTEQKQNFVYALICKSPAPIYEYDVTVTASITEDGTGESRDVSAQLKVYFADYADK